MKTLIFDAQLTGFFNHDLHYSDCAQPKLVGLAAILEDEKRNMIDRFSFVIKPPKGYSVNDAAAKYHGITTETAHAKGIDVGEALDRFLDLMADADRTVAFYAAGHIGAVQTAIFDRELISRLPSPPPEDFCAMKRGVSVFKIPGREGGYKWPKLTEAYAKATGQPFTIDPDQGIEDILSQKVDAVRTIYHYILDQVPNAGRPRDEIP